MLLASPAQAFYIPFTETGDRSVKGVDDLRQGKQFIIDDTAVDVNFYCRLSIFSHWNFYGPKDRSESTLGVRSDPRGVPY